MSKWWANADLDSLAWWHRALTALTGLFTSVMLWIVHGEEVLEKFGKWLGFATKFIERRHDKMNILEIPQFVKDVVQLANDVKAAEAVLAPRFPQLVADADKIKADGEKLLGIETPAVEPLKGA